MGIFRHRVQIQIDNLRPKKLSRAPVTVEVYGARYQVELVAVTRSMVIALVFRYIIGLDILDSLKNLYICSLAYRVNSILAEKSQ